MSFRNKIHFIALFWVLACLNCFCGEPDKKESFLRFRNIVNSGVNGITGRDTIPSDRSDTGCYQFVSIGKQSIRVEYLRNKIAVPFKCPPFFNPLFDTTIIAIKINYPGKNKIKELDFVGGDGNTIFKQIIVNGTVELSYVDGMGRLRNNDSGIAKTALKYDRDGNLIEFKQYDKALKIAENKYIGNFYEDIEKRATIKKWSYSKNHRIEQRNYYDNGSLWDSIRWEYDSTGKVISESYFNDKNKLKNGQYVFARVRYKYDSKKNIIEECYYDENDKLTQSGFGYACVNRDYNDCSGIIEERYSEEDRDGCKLRKFYWDKNNKLEKMQCFDRNGKLISE
jgi:hypothetical protein